MGGQEMPFPFPCPSKPERGGGAQITASKGKDKLSLCALNTLPYILTFG